MLITKLLNWNKYINTQNLFKCSTKETNINFNSRIDLTGDLTNTDCSTGDLTSKYITYICFTVKHRTNTLVYYHNDKYSEEQEQTHNLIKSLHDSGIGHRKISKILN